MATFKIGVALLAAASAAALVLVQYRSEARLRAEIQALRQEVIVLRSENQSLSTPAVRAQRSPSLHLPAPPIQRAPAPPESAGEPSLSGLLASFPALKGKAPNRLTPAHLEAYLKENHRQAASLLAAYQLTGDQALLLEAMKEHPQDPAVALQAALRQSATPGERRQSLDTFKRADPDNALPDYLSALDHFQAGRVDAAVEDLLAASSKPQFRDYSDEGQRAQGEAYQAAGYSAAETKALGLLQQAMIASGAEEEAEALAPLPSEDLLKDVKSLAARVRDLAQSYGQAGDQTSKQAALQMGVELGQRFQNGSSDGFRQLVGTAAELIALRGLDPQSVYGSNDRTVQDRMNELKQQRTGMRRFYEESVPLLGRLSDQDWESYSDRARLFGEPAALQWVLGKCGH